MQEWSDYPLGKLVAQLDAIHVYLGSFAVSIAAFAVGYLISRLLFGKNRNKPGVPDVSMLLCALFAPGFTLGFSPFRWSFLLSTLAIAFSGLVFEWTMFRMAPGQYFMALTEKGLRAGFGFILVMFMAFYRIANIEQETLLQLSLSFGKFSWVLWSLALGMFFTRLASRASHTI